MCYRTRLKSSKKVIEKAFDAKFIDGIKYQPQDENNGFNFSSSPIITDENKAEIQMFNWGLIPTWAKNDKIKKMTLNARVETLSKKPAYRNSVDKRCLIIADGYYEWRWLDSHGRNKQKYLLTAKDQEVFAFAGIYSEWKNPQTNAVVNSYSIVTTEANELMSEIHNNKMRMPIVLKEQDQKSWLDQDDFLQFAFPYEVELNATVIGSDQKTLFHH